MGNLIDTNYIFFFVNFMVKLKINEKLNLYGNNNHSRLNFRLNKLELKK